MSLFGHEHKVHSYSIAGKPISCPQCSGTSFAFSSAQLHSQGMTFFQLEWLGQCAYVLICDTCSHIQWFGREPEETR